LLAYGAENSMMNDEEQYFERFEQGGSTFGKQVLRLKQCCWMNPSAVVECVPKKWESIKINLLHMYEGNFDLDDTRLVIMVAP